MKPALHLERNRPIRRHPTAFPLLAIPILCGLVACGGGTEEAEGPSALLITLDTTRADVLSCYGALPGTTPFLDQLASEGVLYEMAHTAVPVTTPAHASMLTGLYPIRHSVRDNDAWALPDEADTIAELARDRGIQTGAVIAALVLHEQFALNQGFDFYDQPESTGDLGQHSYYERSANQVIDTAIYWLDARDRSRPYFLWVHLYDPHAPYEPPPDFRTGVGAINPYQGEVQFMDSEIGRLFEHMRQDGTFDETFVLVIGDHGEGLQAHDEGLHGMLCYEETLRVPLILRYPDGYRAGDRTDEIVSVVDVFPTLAEALGLPSSEGIDGLSLYRHVVPEDRGVYFETYAGYLGFGYSPVTGWIDSRGKYLHSPQPQFYDIASDPKEARNVLEENAEVVQEFKEKIGELASKRALEATTYSGMDKEMRARLEQLGYVALGGVSAEFPRPLDSSELPCPSSAMEIHRKTLNAVTLYRSGQLAQAEEILRQVLLVTPDNPCALHYLSISLINQRKHAEAIDFLDRLITLRPELGFAHFYKAQCLKETKRFTEATEAALLALEIESENLEYIDLAVFLLRTTGRTELAWELNLRFKSIKDRLEAEGQGR